MYMLFLRVKPIVAAVFSHNLLGFSDWSGVDVLTKQKATPVDG